MNRKGEISVLIFVLLSFILVIGSLFLFATSSAGINVKVYDSGALKKLYSYENEMEFYLWQAGENVLENSKDDADIFKINFKNEFLKYNFEENYMKELKKMIEENKFEVVVDDGNFYIKINGFKLEEKSGDVGIIYYPRIFVKA